MKVRVPIRLGKLNDGEGEEAGEFMALSGVGPLSVPVRGLVQWVQCGETVQATASTTALQPLSPSLLLTIAVF